jgi:hypothetical protein
MWWCTVTASSANLAGTNAHRALEIRTSTSGWHCRSSRLFYGQIKIRTHVLESNNGLLGYRRETPFCSKGGEKRGIVTRKYITTLTKKQ